MDLPLSQQREAHYVEAEKGRMRASTWAMNQSGLLLSVLYLAYTVAFDPASVVIPVAMIAGFAVAWGMLQYDVFGGGRALAIATAYVGITAGTIRFGGNANVHLLFAILILSILACLNGLTLRVLLCVIAVCTGFLAGGGYLDGLFLGYGAGVDAPHETAFYTILNMVAYYWFCDDLLKINRKFRLQSRHYVDAIGARSAQLHLDLRRLGRQSEDLRAANDALGDELAKGEHVQRQLRASKEQLEQFVYAASHDLKEPLRSIAGFIQLIRRKVSHHEDANLTEYFDFVLNSSTAMTQLLDGLLAYSRVSRDDIPPEDVDLDRLALVTKVELRQRLASTGGTVEIDGGMAPAFCSKRAAQEILRHLVDNGLKFVRPGERPRVVIGPCPAQPTDAICVRDYGIGIDPAFYNKIFLLFQRLNLVDDFEGAGIGLAMVRKLAAANGITVEVLAPPAGPGTVFRLQFPRTAAAQAPAHA